MKQDRLYAVVYINGRKIFLGKWGSVEADTEYRRILAEWVSNPVFPGTKSNGLAKIDELALAFLKWAKEYHEYRTYHCFKTAIETMLELYGGISIRDFGCRKLTTLQSLFISKGYVRTQVNRFVCCIKRVFSWGVKEELVGGQSKPRCPLESPTCQQKWVPFAAFCTQPTMERLLDYPKIIASFFTASNAMSLLENLFSWIHCVYFALFLTIITELKYDNIVWRNYISERNLFFYVNNRNMISTLDL